MSASPGFEACVVAYQRTLVAALRRRHALCRLRAAGAQRGKDARLPNAVQTDHDRAAEALRRPRQLEQLELALRRRHALPCIMYVAAALAHRLAGLGQRAVLRTCTAHAPRVHRAWLYLLSSAPSATSPRPAPEAAAPRRRRRWRSRRRRAAAPRRRRTAAAAAAVRQASSPASDTVSPVKRLNTGRKFGGVLQQQRARYLLK